MTPFSSWFFCLLAHKKKNQNILKLKTSKPWDRKTMKHISANVTGKLTELYLLSYSLFCSRAWTRGSTGRYSHVTLGNGFVLAAGRSHGCHFSLKKNNHKNTEGWTLQEKGQIRWTIPTRATVVGRAGSHLLSITQEYIRQSITQEYKFKNNFLNTLTAPNKSHFCQCPGAGSFRPMMQTGPRPPSPPYRALLSWVSLWVPAGHATFAWLTTGCCRGVMMPWSGFWKAEMRLCTFRKSRRWTPGAVCEAKGERWGDGGAQGPDAEALSSEMQLHPGMERALPSAPSACQLKAS